ncbi:MAG: hypothetical protein ACR2OE_03775 [Thermomicrobiales bacterium]
MVETSSTATGEEDKLARTSIAARDFSTALEMTMSVRASFVKSPY